MHRMEHRRAGSFIFPADAKLEHSLIELNDIEADVPESMNSTKTLLLTGGRPIYVNSLSSREMDSLAALCDTLLPSIHVSFSGAIDHHSLLTFFSTSASMAGTPQHPKTTTSKEGSASFVFMALVDVVRDLHIVWEIELVDPVSLLSEILSNISEEPGTDTAIMVIQLSLPYQDALQGLQVPHPPLLLHSDEKNENPSWKAIGYCGPDPEFKTQTHGAKTSDQCRYRRAEEEEELYGPLHRGLVDPAHPREILAETLGRSGFHVSIHSRRKCKAPSTSSPSLTIRCDAVVVGSGSGGGVAAGVLAKAGYKVLVLEKGNYCARSKLSLLEGAAMDEMYQGGGLLATDDLGVVILAGSTVGGGSTVNWSASIRTPRHVIKEWCNTYELELFDSKLYKEALDVVCERMGVQSDIHEEGFNNAVLRRGCHELGYRVCNIPRNSSPDHYCGWCCLGCKDGRKKGTLETWLVDLVNSGNGVILPGCEALKVLRERKKGSNRDTATGVAFEFNNGGGEKDVYVVESKVTVVACGALSTPTLLQKSGLKNANIGKHLHLHPVAMAWGYFPDSSPSTEWPEEEKKSYEGGIMTAMSTVVANFEGSGYGAVIQTPALHPGMFSVVTPWVSGFDIKERMCKFSRTAHIFALARDRGSGKVISPSSLSYQMDVADEENLKKGLEKILRILAAAGAEVIGTHHCKGNTINVKRVSSHKFERFVKEESARGLRNLSTPICSAHQMGSCRMGVDPKRSVVNQRGETWEVDGLFVADTSVFPTALGVNPMVTVQAIAYCTAQSILEVLRRKKDGY
ncbi:hypothetical protein HHK36_028342 [Tetracentron sinense]|uniref:long-chain-alcohol oxidase n=1 Tax=Tetracentron sinense TaxID=13715 RepID=A0A835D210_TETSI|nr:hypothetical protein HHK36_028342 [Tetracentron sinense]